MKNFSIFLLVILIGASTGQAQVIKVSAESIPVTLDHVSLPLTELAKTSKYVAHPQRLEVENPSLERGHEQTNPNPYPHGPDPAWQKNYATTRDLQVNVISVWDGLTDNIDPADVNIAVGPNHVMQMINLTYMRIWDKSGNVLISQLDVEDITGPLLGDPDGVYDPVADRFVFTAVPNLSNKLVIAISKTNDPTGEWYVYNFKTSGGFPDYPKIGFWGNSYFITTNSNKPYIFALKRDSLLAGAAIGDAQKFSVDNFPVLSIQDVAPVTFTGTIPPDEGAEALFVRVADDAWGSSIDSDHLEYVKLHVDWENDSLSFLSGPFSLYTVPYDSKLCDYDALTSCIEQPSGTDLETMNSLVLDKVQYRRFSDYESIVCSHVCDVDATDRAGMRWYELRKNSGNDWFIYQTGTYSPDENARWMGSISINGDGSIALGYSIASNTIYTSARVTGRLACDSLGNMTAAETEVMTGGHKNAAARWGDYSSLVTDPVDNSFWYTAMYNPTDNGWTTAVAHFSLNNNNCEVPASVYTQVMCDGTVCFTDTVSGGVMSVFYDFGDGDTGAIADPCHTYASSGAYTVSTIICGSLGCDTVYSIVNATIVSAEISYTGALSTGSDIEFSSNSTGASSWNWDFGDGSSSDQADPTHAYNTPGIYIVTLTISDDGGCSFTTSDTLNIIAVGATQSYPGFDVNLFPNPANHESFLTYTLPEPMAIKVELWNQIGVKLQTIASTEMQMPGKYIYPVKPAEVGLYYVKVDAGNRTIWLRLDVVK